MQGTQSAVGAAIEIDMKVEHIDGLFSPFDSASIAERALSAEADQYIMERIEHHGEESLPPTKWRLRLLLPADEAHRFGDVRTACRNHFARQATRSRQALTRHFRSAWSLLFISIAFAIGLSVLAQWIADFSDVRFLERIANGLAIVVWVMVWRPVEMLVHDWRPLRDEANARSRLAEVEVECSAG